MAMNKPTPKTDYSKQPYAKKGKRGTGSSGSMTHKYNRGMHYSGRMGR